MVGPFEVAFIEKAWMVAWFEAPILTTNPNWWQVEVKIRGFMDGMMWVESKGDAGIRLPMQWEMAS